MKHFPSGQLYYNSSGTWNVTKLFKASKKLFCQYIEIDSLLKDKEVKEDVEMLKVFYLKHVLSVDLRYPIIVNAENLVMDGYHRLAKATILRKRVIRARKFKVTPPPDI